MTTARPSDELIMGRPRAEVEALGFEDFWRLWDEHQAREVVAEKARRQAIVDQNRASDARFRAAMARLDDLIERMKDSNRLLIERHGLKPEDLVRREPFRP